MFRLLSILIMLTWASCLFAQGERGAVPLNTSESGISYNNVYGLIVGISDYEEVAPLKYAHKDAQLISKALHSSFANSNKEIITLTDESATEFSILEGLSTISGKAKDGDLVVFYFAGHGDVAYVEGSKRGYFLTSTASKSREYEAGGAVRFDAIHDSIISITSNGAHVYLITDACRSGKIIDAKGASLTLNALNTGYEKTTKFVSCQANELSYEFDHLGHGVFTYYLVKALDHGFSNEQFQNATVRHLNRSLMDSVETATSFKQSPTVMGANRNAEVFNFFDVQPIFGEIQMGNALAERNAGSSSTSQSVDERIKNALLDGNLTGSSSSALFLYNNAVNYKSLSKEQLSDIRNLLVSELMDRAQNTMNDFLSGDIRAHKELDFEGARFDLDKAAELIGAGHPFFKTINHRSQFFKAMELMNSGEQKQLEEAKSILLYLEKNEPKATYVQQGLGMLYIQLNDKQNAIETLKKARNRIDTWSKPINSGAELKILAGELGEAIKDLNFAEDISKNPAEASLLRAKLHLANEQLMQAQKAIEKATKLGWKDQTETSLLLGKIEQLRGRINEAEDVYGEELKVQTDDAELLLRLGDLALDNRDSSQAISYYTKALNKVPSNEAIKNKISLLKGSSSVFGNVDIYNIDQVLLQLENLYANKSYNEGLSLVEKALGVNNWYPAYHYEHGKFLYALNKPNDAARVLRKSLEMSPYNFKSIKALVIILIEQDKKNEANDLITKYDLYFTGSSRWLTFKYKSYYQMKSTKDLFPILEEAIELDSLDLTPRREMILLHIEANRFEYAFKEYEELMKVGGNDYDKNQLFVNVNNQVLRAYQNKIYQGLLPGINYLVQEDPLTLEYQLMGSMIAYMSGDYKKAKAYVLNLQRNTQLLSPAFQLELLKIKGKIYLETKQFKEAEMAFMTYNKRSGQKEYLGLAMAQFELGMKRDWPTNFKKGGNIEEYNPAAFERYQLMMKKMK